VKKGRNLNIFLWLRITDTMGEQIAVHKYLRLLKIVFFSAILFPFKIDIFSFMLISIVKSFLQTGLTIKFILSSETYKLMKFGLFIGICWWRNQACRRIKNILTPFKVTAIYTPVSF
jgi:hypothetical protein